MGAFSQRENSIPMIIRNAITLQPPLNRGVVLMAQHSRNGSNPATRPDNVCVGLHGNDVRLERTPVNVENVHRADDNGVMANSPTIGERIRGILNASGLTFDEVAQRAGYKGRSSVQAFFSPDYNPDNLSPQVARKLAKAFPEAREELLAMAGIVDTNGLPLKYEGAADVTLRRDLPVYGTALGAPVDFDGTAIEQTTLNTGDVIGYLPRPTVLNGHKAAYGLYVQGSSMAPRHEDGDTLFVTDSRRSTPPRLGDDVVVYLRNGDDEDPDHASGVLIKRLVRRTGSYIELEQFNPAITFRIEIDRVIRVDRVIPWRELLS